MPSFENFMARHGEAYTQNLIENIERFSGVRIRLGEPLEHRWVSAMARRPRQDNGSAEIH